MAQFQRPNPFQPGYAVPNYVYGEPPGRGTLTTKGLPRGTIDTADAHKTQANYAVPGYVLAETTGRGAYDTDMIPRRWVDTKAMDTLARPFPNVRGSLSGTVFSKKTLKGSSLGDVNAYGRTETSPFRLYGIEAVQWIEKNILENRKLSPAQKKTALMRVLDGIDPKLRLIIDRKAQGYRQRGMLPGAAFRKAMADALSEGLMGEVQKLGKRGLSGTSRLFKGRMGLGALGSTSTSAPQKIKIDVGGAQFDVTRYPDGHMEGTKRYTSSGGLDGLHLPAAVRSAFVSTYDTIRNKFKGSMISDLWKGVTDGQLPIIRFGSGHGVYLKLSPEVRTQADADRITSAVLTIKKIPPPSRSWIEKGVDAVTGAIVGIVTLPFKIVEMSVDIAGDALDKLGGLACKAVNSDLGVIAAGTAGGAYGGTTGAQAGMMGASIAQGMCGKTSPPVQQQTGAIWPWLLAGGGVVLVVLAVK